MFVDFSGALYVVCNSNGSNQTANKQADFSLCCFACRLSFLFARHYLYLSVPDVSDSNFSIL